MSGFTATQNVTLLDIAKANGADPVVGLIDETTKAHPELEVIPGRTIKGVSYKTFVRTGLPQGSFFRNANTGSRPGKSTYEERNVDTFIFDPRIEADKAVADAYEDGPQAWLAIEGDGVIEASAQQLCRQFYYGRNTWTISSVVYGGDAISGFPGLVDGYNRNLYEFSAGGTTANTGTSVYAIKFGEKCVQWVYGLNGAFSLSDVMIQRVLDASGNPFTAYCQEILARPGLQIGSLRGLGRLKNITDDSGHTLTDAMLAQWIAQFEVGWKPDILLMNRRARRQLQLSRTVVLQGGGVGMPGGGSATIAPTPESYDGIPIRVTDSILDVEPLTL